MTMWRSSLKTVGLLAFVAGAVAGCDPETGEVEGVDIANEFVRECPHTPDWGDNGSSRVIEAEISDLTRGAHHVPEYNDCQRFIVGSADAPVYDSLYAIFAVPDDSLDEKLTKVMLGAGKTAPGRPQGDSGLAVAVIWSRGGSYEPLSIRPGFSCVVLSRTRAAPGWRASIQPATGTADCSGSRPMDQGGDLTVRVASPLEDEEHYPTVARWGFDVTSHSHFVAVRCGAGVCYLGPPDFTPTPTPTIPSDKVTPKQQRVYSIALWHDEQPLAMLPDGASRVVPAGVHGTVIPHRDLGDYNTDAAFANRWTTVSEVYMSSAHAAYEEKMYFGATTAERPNLIQSCKIVGADGSCPGVPTSLDCSGVDEDTGERWRTRHVRAGDGAVKHFCVRRYPLTNSNVGVPAAARWRWLASDETTWHRCKNGCCDEQP